MVICHICGHRWDYKGSKKNKRAYVTCPSCLSKVRLIKKDENKRKAAKSE